MTSSRHITPVYIKQGIAHTHSSHTRIHTCIPTCIHGAALQDPPLPPLTPWYPPCGPCGVGSLPASPLVVVVVAPFHYYCGLGVRSVVLPAVTLGMLSCKTCITVIVHRCPQHHRHNSHLGGAGGLHDSRFIEREFPQNVDSYEDDDADEHDPCQCLLG